MSMGILNSSVDKVCSTVNGRKFMWPDLIKHVVFLTSSTITLYVHVGVEKNSDDSRRNYFSSNRWDLCGDILRTEVRLYKQQREKRTYTKRNDTYWTDGITEARSAKKARYSAVYS